MSEEMNEGGRSAFPVPRGAVEPGVSLFAYLVAHAPAVPWEWFQPVAVETHEVMTRDGETVEIAGGFDRAEWLRERDKQWPAYWAREMMRQMSREDGGGVE